MWLQSDASFGFSEAPLNTLLARARYPSVVANPKKNGRQTTQLGQSAPYYLVQSCRTDWVHTGAFHRRAI
jgi:hypothetical protein